MKGRVIFEFELDGEPTRSDYEQHVTEAACIMHDRLIGEGFTENEDGLRAYLFKVEITSDDDAEIIFRG